MFPIIETEKVLKSFPILLILFGFLPKIVTVRRHGIFCNHGLIMVIIQNGICLLSSFWFPNVSILETKMYPGLLFLFLIKNFQ